ncbi:MAG: hypothetical protein OEM32_00165 [Acidimicrobiia bacterium]|nr:hypothetical protein [Acidimicrobiia bacterium]
MRGILVVVYDWYFAVIIDMVQSSPIADISCRPLMLVTMGPLGVLAVIGHFFLAVIPPHGDHKSDERDRHVDLKGEWTGGFALGTAAVTSVFLAMAETESFRLANTLFADLVLSEIVTSVAKLAYFRRMAW